MRLRRSNLSSAGYGRRRRGRSFSYTGTEGRPLTDPDALARIRALVIPPAWKDVWICPDPRGHIQAAGTDAAGRRQYLYHDVWRRKRDEEKFDHVLDVARRLPRLRRRVAADLRGAPSVGPGAAGRRAGGRTPSIDRLTRERVLAAVARLIDLGLFRVGSDQYAKGDEATYGVTTLLPEHVRIRRTGMEFRYPAKGGIERVCSVVDDDVCRVLTQLRRRRDRSRLFAYRDAAGWHDVHSEDVNGYLKHASGIDMSAKDFRTWNATVLAATLLAEHDPRGVPQRRRDRTVARVMREVAEELGNTPAVAKASYVDPRVIDRYHDGAVIEPPARGGRPALESEVLRLLADR